MVKDKPEVCNPLSVMSNLQGKLRLVLNLRYLNQFLYVLKFKYDNQYIAALSSLSPMSTCLNLTWSLATTMWTYGWGITNTWSSVGMKWFTELLYLKSSRLVCP